MIRRVVMDIATGKIIDRETSHYAGPVAWCKGPDTPDPPKPPPLPPPPTMESIQVKEARWKEREAARRRKGFLSSILTSGLGALGQPQVLRKELFGE